MVRNPFAQIASAFLRGWWHTHVATGRCSGAPFDGAFTKAQAPFQFGATGEEQLARYGSNLRNLLGRVLEFVGLQTINEHVAPRVDHWHNMYQDAFVADPPRELRRLCGFLGVACDDAFVEAAVSIVSPVLSKPEQLLEWPSDVADRVSRCLSTLPAVARFAPFALPLGPPANGTTPWDAAATLADPCAALLATRCTRWHGECPPIGSREALLLEEHFNQ